MFVFSSKRGLLVIFIALSVLMDRRKLPRAAAHGASRSSRLPRLGFAGAALPTQGPAMIVRRL